MPASSARAEPAARISISQSAPSWGRRFRQRPDKWVYRVEATVQGVVRGDHHGFFIEVAFCRSGGNEIQSPGGEGVIQRTPAGGLPPVRHDIQRRGTATGATAFMAFAILVDPGAQKSSAPKRTGDNDQSK